MWPNLQETGDVVTFTKEILYGKLHFLCSKLLMNISILVYTVPWSNDLWLKDLIKIVLTSCTNTHLDSQLSKCMQQFKT